MPPTLAQRVADLERLAVLARSLPTPHGARLADAIRAHLDDGVSLDTSIGLTPSERTQLARDRRDDHLRAAAASLDAPSDWARAELLAEAVRKFQGPQGRRWRESTAPANAQPWIALQRAYRCHTLPSTPRQLHEVLKSAPLAISEGPAGR